MKKAEMIILILLVIVVGLLLYVKKNERKVEIDSNSQHGSAEKNAEEVIKIAFLDIGQGDATFIEFPSGEQMLVDCAKDARVIEALGRVMEFYDRSIDYLVVTHPDNDHYGGCIDVLKRFDVGSIVYNGLKKENDEMWQEFWSAVQEEQATYVEIDTEQVWDVASTTLHFLYPDHSIPEDPFIPGQDKKESDNNTSIVFKLKFGEQDILMTGDMEAPLEEYLVEKYGDQLDVEVLKVGHHGSGGSSSQLFVDAVTPEYATISAGVKNRYGHPSRRVLRRLERASSTIWRTDEEGDILMVIGRDGVEVKE